MAINPNLLQQQDTIRQLTGEQLDGIIDSKGQSPLPGFLAAAELGKRAREQKAAQGAEASERLKQQVQGGPTVMARISNELSGVPAPTPMPQGMAPQAAPPQAAPPQAPPGQGLGGGGYAHGGVVHGRDLNSVGSRNIQSFSQGGAVGGYYHGGAVVGNYNEPMATPNYAQPGFVQADQGLVLDGQAPASQPIVNFSNGGPVTNSPAKPPDRYFQQGNLLPSDITHYAGGGAVQGFERGGGIPRGRTGLYDEERRRRSPGVHSDPIVDRRLDQYEADLDRKLAEQGEAPDAGEHLSTLTKGIQADRRARMVQGPESSGPGVKEILAGRERRGAGPAPPRRESSIGERWDRGVANVNETLQGGVDTFVEALKPTSPMGLEKENWPEFTHGMFPDEEAAAAAPVEASPDGPTMQQQERELFDKMGALGMQVPGHPNQKPTPVDDASAAKGLDDVPETQEEKAERAMRAKLFAEMAVGLLTPGSTFLEGLAIGTKAGSATFAAHQDKVLQADMSARLAKQKSDQASANYEQRDRKIQNDLVGKQNATRRDAEDSAYERADLLLAAALGDESVELPDSQDVNERGELKGGKMQRQELAAYFYQQSIRLVDLTNSKKSGALVGGATRQNAGSR